MSNKDKLKVRKKPFERNSSQKAWSLSHKDQSKPKPRLPKPVVNTFLNQINFKDHKEYRSKVLQSMEKRIFLGRK